MKFVSNIGWISKNNGFYAFEILNCGYQFEVPINEMDDLINRNQSEIIFKVLPIDDIGICTYNGRRIIVDIGDKEFTTPMIVFNQVRSGLRKPISENVNRDDININPYNIYNKILDCLKKDPSEETSKILEKYKDSTIELLNKYHGKIDCLDYNDPKIQTGYMLCYFPYYIENCYQLFGHLNSDNFRQIFKEKMNTNFYGCGPSPDFLGFSAFLNNQDSLNVREVNSNFYDMNNWSCWRHKCINEFSKLFGEGPEITANSNDLNLLNCDDPSVFSKELAKNVNLHIFQNCTTDIYSQFKNPRKTCSIFNNIYEQIDPGSVMIINDIIGNGDSMKILNLIKDSLIKKTDSLLLDHNYNADEYTPHFNIPSEVNRFLNACYKEVGIKPRNQRTGYTYLAIKKEA